MEGSSEIQRSVPISLKKLGTSFTIWGLLGFWLKAILAVVAGLLALISLLPSGANNPPSLNRPNAPNIPVQAPVDPSNSGLELVLILCGVALLAASAYWSYRYILWGRRLKLSSSQNGPSKQDTLQLLQLGLGLDLLGMLFTLLVGEMSVGFLLYKSLTQTVNFFNYRIGPLDVIVIFACVHLAVGQYVGILTSLYLMRRSSQPQR